MIFDRDGNQTRDRKRACSQCGSMTECDECWEHVCDWSPFGVWHCLLCRMPQFFIDGGLAPIRCEYCGWDEATECETIRHGTN